MKIKLFAMIIVVIGTVSCSSTVSLNRKMVESAFKGDLQTVKSCVAAGANIDARYDGDPSIFKDKHGGWPGLGGNWTALMAAIYGDKIEISTFLVEKGANVNLDNRMGLTPLYLLASKLISKEEYDDLARLLISKGADVDVKRRTFLDGPSELTILHQAVAGGHKNLVKMLVESKAAVNAKTSSGMTPLDYITKGRSNVEIRKILIEAGAKAGTSNLSGGVLERFDPTTLKPLTENEFEKLNR